MSVRFRLPTLVGLAARDLAHGWRSTSCLVLGVAIALAPLLLLYGLNFGFVSGLIAQLRQDPRTRELRPVGQYEFDAAWFEALQADERVGFLLPRTRYLASSATLRAEDFPGVLEVELIPTRAGDPLLPEGGAPQTPRHVVLSASTAATSSVGAGDEIVLQIFRLVGEKRESVRSRFTVAGVLGRGLLERDAVFVSPAFVEAAERWIEGEGWGWPDDVASGDRSSYASFRLFARDVRDVPSLRDDLVEQGIDVRTRAESIANALAIEKGLGWVFLVVTVLASTGFLLTLGLHLAASVIDKAKELSILRLLGLRSYEISLLPMLQGSMIAAGGASVAGLAVMASQSLVNDRLAGLAGFSGDLSQLQWSHVLVGIAASCLAGALAAAVAGVQASHLEPAEGLRRE